MESAHCLPAACPNHSTSRLIPPAGSTSPGASRLSTDWTTQERLAGFDENKKPQQDDQAIGSQESESTVWPSFSSSSPPTSLPALEWNQDQRGASRLVRQPAIGKSVKDDELQSREQRTKAGSARWLQNATVCSLVCATILLAISPSCHSSSLNSPTDSAESPQTPVDSLVDNTHSKADNQANSWSAPQDFPAPLARRSLEISSADLPAEFRGEIDDETEGNSPVGGQSKLARLCQQTSSVLASVLPAPFGGHKRSILCQFFGQMPLSDLRHKKQQQQPVSLYPVEQESIAVLQPGNQQPPIMMLANGRHPIQMVLEQQQRQMMMSAIKQQTPRPLSVANLASQDLKSSASVIDYAYHQRVEAPSSMQSGKVTAKPLKQKVKYSAPVDAFSFKPVASTSSGWRIFNQVPFEMTSTQPSVVVASDGQVQRGNDSQASAATNKSLKTATISKANEQPKVAQLDHIDELAPGKSTQVLVLGKPPGFNGNSSTTTSTVAIHQLARQQSTQSSLGKRSEELKSTTRSSARVQEDGVRTIEIQSQQSANLSASNARESRDVSQLSSWSASAANGNSSLTTTTQRPNGKENEADTNKRNKETQTLKREELVIASINNLTRIAFGNQLRDTVKVINKLIDQQANLFKRPNTGDPMWTSETRQAVSGSTSGGKSASSADGKDTVQAASSEQASKIRQKQIVSNSLSTAKPSKKLTTALKTKGSDASKSSHVTISTTKKAFLSSQKLSTTRPVASTSPAKAISGRAQRVDQQVSERTTTRRMHAASRSLDFDLRKSTKPPDDQDLITALIGDIHRDKTGPWKLSGNFVAQQRAKGGSMEHKAARSTPAKLWFGSGSTETTVTKYPWLMPDKVYHSNLFGASLGSSSTTRKTAETKTPRVPPLDLASSASTVHYQQSSKVPALVLNRLSLKAETTPSLARHRQDSLTTLKMSLMPTISNTNPTTIRSTGTTQSRWIPTLTTMRTSPAPEQSSKPGSLATTITTTASPTTVAPTSNAAGAQTETSTTKEEPKGSSSSQIDLNEARASDSISRYTTHLAEANELLATTSRRFFQQPMPQIAQTGEYFSAETIASWPERYQTMLAGQSAINELRTTPSLIIESTRRNGESYDAGRHRTTTMDDGTTTSRSNRYDLSTDLADRVTLLPANHKLSTVAQETTPSATASSSESKDENSLSFGLQLSPVKSIAYTLIGPVTSSENQPEPAKSPAPSELPAHNSSSPSPSMRPPYLEIQPPISDHQMASDEPIDVASDGQEDATILFGGRPHVSRKLYELLVPSTRNFVGAGNPLNQQQLNLSALKFLAQSLLQQPRGSRNQSAPELDLHPIGSLEAQADSKQQLLDLIGSEHLPVGHYEMLGNSTSTDNSTLEHNSTTQDKGGFLTKASHLLSDLKQLEQRRAAAILAAIRYQVPGPLIRPWDLASDLAASDLISPPVMSERRLYSESNLLRDRLLMSQLSRALRAAITSRQRLVPRHELEARLNGSRSGQLQILQDESTDEDLERREDFVQEQELMDEKEVAPVVVGLIKGRKKIQQALLGRMINTKSAINGSSSGDFHLIDLAGGVPRDDDDPPTRARHVPPADHEASTAYPRYIRLTIPAKVAKANTDMVKTAGIDDPGAAGELASSGKQSVNNRQSREPIKSAQQAKSGKNNKEQFDCSQRAAGFYPDAGSACQTFYHCSNTGHLLTFNCPLQTRFDERSLKCSAWFEVPCDLTRSKFGQTSSRLTW